MVNSQAALPTNSAEQLNTLIEVLRELAIAANNPDSFTQTLQILLEIVGNYYDFVLGRISIVGTTGPEGRTHVSWVNASIGDEELPPQVWSDIQVDTVLGEGTPVVIARSNEAGREDETFRGLGSSIQAYIGAPIKVDGADVGVMAFLSNRPIEFEKGAMNVFNHAATLIGLVLERNQAQAKINESEGRFRGVFDQSVQSISLLNPDGTVFDVNKTALEIGMVPPNMVKGRKFWEAYWWQVTDQTRHELRSAVERAAAGEFVRYEVPAQDRNGNKVVIDLSIKPIRNKEGAIILLVTEGRNITPLRLALEHLSSAERRLKEAQRIAHIGHWEYSYTSAQAAYSDTLWEIFGLDPDTSASTAEVFMSRIHPEDLSSLQRTLNRSYQLGIPFEQNFRIVQPDGTIRMVYTTGGTIYDETGHPARMAGIIQDISGRRKLEDSLAHSVERLSGLNLMGQAVASSLDLTIINEIVLRTGRRLLNAESVVFFTHEGSELVITAVDHEGDLNLLGRRINENSGIAGECWTTGQTLWLSGEECRAQLSDQLVDQSGHNPGSIIAVPVRWQNALLGVLEATDSREDAFTADDIGMLEAVANWMAIAIGKVSQHQALQRRLQESEAIAEVSRALGQTLEPQVILEMIVNTAHDLVPRSDWAVIHLLVGRPEHLEPAAVAGTEEDLSDYIIASDEGLAGLAMKEGMVLNVGDTRSDQRSSAFARQLGLRSLLVAPIRSRNRTLGTITLHCMEINAFSEEDGRLLTILSAQAGLAIENAQLFDSQRRARLVAELQRERMRTLADRIVTAQEEERLRISRELHDEAGQALTSLKISLDLIRSGLPHGLDALRDRLADLADLTGSTMETLRNLAHDLRPPGLDAFGLNVALEGLCHDFANRVNIHIVYQGEELPPMPTTVALSMYRFAQEALTNIGKHADASKVEVKLSLMEKVVELRVTDDGKGFTYEPEFKNGSGVGLVSMQERIDLVGGTLEIATSPGQGTHLIARVPR